jgi:DNA-binding NarL/FixJ family response regulator
MEILILEDHPIVLDAIKTRIEREVAGAHITYAGSSLDEALLSIDRTKPRCAVVDLDLGDGRAPVDIISALAMKGIPILVMSALGEAAVVKSVLAAGARGYFTKTASLDQLIIALTTVIAGGSYLSPQIAGATYQTPTTLKLSNRERSALVLYTSGLTMEEVAKRMGIATSTASEYVDRVRSKFRGEGRNAKTKMDLYRLAQEYGLI